LIEDDFHRHSGIGTSKDDGKGLLTGCQFNAPRPARQSIVTSDIGHES
jgi:hypothetical protein